MSEDLSYLKSFFSRTPTDTQEFILNSLNSTKELDSNVFLDFMSADDKIFYQAKAKCIHFSEKIARFYFHSGIKDLPFKNAKVACFFILQKGNTEIPYSYISTVVEVEQQKTSVYIDVAIPTEITHTQRRETLRIPMTQEKNPTLRLWAEKERQNTTNNGKDDTVWDPISQENFKLINISAGGLQINVPKRSFTAHQLRKNFAFMCTGSFEFPQKPTEELVLIAIVKRVGNPDETSWNSVGLKFHRWAKIEDGKTTWTDISESDSGIAILGAWLVPSITKLNKN